jgi:peptidoglycan hydrolase FlgJ
MIPIGSIGSAPATTPAKAEAPDPKTLQAAKDFEAIFVRQMLKSLEKTTAAGCGTQASAGEKTYGSMIVDTLSESISKAGGLGLADVIARSLAVEHPSLAAKSATVTSGSAAAVPLISPLKPLK